VAPPFRVNWRSKEERDTWFQSFAPNVMFENEPLVTTSHNLVHINLTFFANAADAKELSECIAYTLKIRVYEVKDELAART
jgi:hypothetical protein